MQRLDRDDEGPAPFQIGDVDRGRPRGDRLDQRTRAIREVERSSRRPASQASAVFAVAHEIGNWARFAWRPRIRAPSLRARAVQVGVARGSARPPAQLDDRRIAEDGQGRRTRHSRGRVGGRGNSPSRRCGERRCAAPEGGAADQEGRAPQICGSSDNSAVDDDGDRAERRGGETGRAGRLRRSHLRTAPRRASVRSSAPRWSAGRTLDARQSPAKAAIHPSRAERDGAFSISDAKSIVVAPRAKASTKCGVAIAARDQRGEPRSGAAPSRAIAGEDERGRQRSEQMQDRVFRPHCQAPTTAPNSAHCARRPPRNKPAAASAAAQNAIRVMLWLTWIGTRSRGRRQSCDEATSSGLAAVDAAEEQRDDREGAARQRPADRIDRRVAKWALRARRGRRARSRAADGGNTKVAIQARRSRPPRHRGESTFEHQRRADPHWPCRATRAATRKPNRRSKRSMSRDARGVFELSIRCNGRGLTSVGPASRTVRPDGRSFDIVRFALARRPQSPIDFVDAGGFVIDVVTPHSFVATPPPHFLGS